MTNTQIIKQIEQQNNICLKQVSHDEISDTAFIKEQIEEPGKRRIMCVFA